MIALYVFGAIMFVHSALYFLHTILSLYWPKYHNFLDTTQLNIQVMRVGWYTTRFNQNIKNWTMNRRRFWQIWFDVGILATILLLPLSISLPIKMTTDFFMDESIREKHKSHTLQIVIPGIDTPMDELGYFALSLFICSLFHEIGHAISSQTEDVRIHGLGMIVIFIIPVAYVQIDSERLSSSSIRSQLRITCAGIWHNLILTLLAMFLLNSGTLLYKPFYTKETGVSVQLILPNSPLIGLRGLEMYDNVKQINDCSVRNTEDWENCIMKTYRQDNNPGYCTAGDFIKNFNHMSTFNESLDCCNVKLKEEGCLCFTFIKTLRNVDVTLHLCLPARNVITQSSKSCASDSDCNEGQNYCLKSILEHDVRIVKIKRLNKQDIIFVGDPLDIFKTVKVSNWVPKFSFSKYAVPDKIDLMYKYIATFSSGLVILNAIPCFYFDGNYISDIFIYFILNSCGGYPRLYRIISYYTKLSVSFLFGFNVLYNLLLKFS